MSELVQGWVPVKALPRVYMCMSVYGSVWMPVHAHRARILSSYLRGESHDWPLGKSQSRGYGWELFLSYNENLMCSKG